MKDNYDISSLRRKPKRKNSRRKGNSFELSIAKIFNERFNSEEFSRAPTSGAFATTHKLPAYLKFYGDLLTPEKFKFTIECKKGYPSVNLLNLYNSNSSEFWKFIEQSGKDSVKANKDPMVIHKQDRRPIVAIVPANVEFPVDIYIEIHKKGKSYKIYQFEDILSCYDPYWFTG